MDFQKKQGPGNIQNLLNMIWHFMYLNPSSSIRVVPGLPLVGIYILIVDPTDTAEGFKIPRAGMWSSIYAYAPTKTLHNLLAGLGLSCHRILRSKWQVRIKWPFAQSTPDSPPSKSFKKILRSAFDDGTYNNTEYLSKETDHHAHIDEKALLRKIDIHVIPWLTLLYLLNFMDRGSIGNAKVT